MKNDNVKKKKRNTKKNFKEKDEEVIETIVLNDNNGNNKRLQVSDGFYYLIGIILSLVLIFATDELLSTINYLFVVIFAIIAIVQVIGFIMDKDYLKRDYSSLIICIMCTWIAMFVYKYGNFLFLEMLPALISLLLFIMATSSFTKYFDRKIIGNLIVSIVSIILGILLLFVSKNIMYILFKIVGVYIFVMIMLDFIDYRKKRDIE